MERSVKEIVHLSFLSLAGIIFVGVLMWGFCALGRVYSVWSSMKEGEAELSHAEFNRQIATLEAKQKEESSYHLAQSEIIRARGVAEANRIIGDSLKGNEAYLKYLWIDGLQNSKGQVVYVPTEANLPILEAGRR